MFNKDKGMKVLIIEDCRKGGVATGKVGIHEGDFPLTVAFGVCIDADSDSEFYQGEWDYESYVSGNLLVKVEGIEKPAKDVFIEWVKGTPRPAPRFAMPMTNPRIRLEDGSVIWGAECWWKPFDENQPPIEELQKQVDSFTRAYAAVIESGITAGIIK